jgi:nucleoside-diphosphate-sugar epimerase
MAGNGAANVSADVVIVGCGDLGSAVAEMLQSAQLSVLGLRRHPDPQASFPCVSADICQPASLAKIAQTQAKILLYCVAATEQSDANYYQQYVLGLQHCIQVCQQMAQPPLIIFVSSTRMYGQDSPQPLDETSPALHADFGGQRLMQAEQLLQTYAQSIVLRLTGIYGPGRNRLLHWAANPALWPAENKWTNRIHRDDAAGFIVHLMQAHLNAKALQSMYIVTDHEPAPMHQVLAYFAEQLGVTVPAVETPVSGRFFSNQRLRETGYQLRYENYRSGGYLLTMAG